MRNDHRPPSCCRHLPALALALLSAAAVAGRVQAGDWRALGPSGVTVSAFAAVPGLPDDAYLVPEGLPARVMYTSDAGADWVVRDSLPDRVDCVAVDPAQVNIVYCAGKRGIVYRSTDYGRFFAVRANLGGGVSVRQISLNPVNRARLWAAGVVTEGDSARLAVFSSTDSAANWSALNLAAGFAADAAVLHVDPARPHRVFAGGTVNNTPRLFVTRNGTDWTDISSGLAGSAVFGLAASPTDSTVLVCGTDSGLFRTTDLGASWTRRHSAPVWSVAFAPSSPYYGYAGSDNLVFRSNDNGLFWSAETTDFFGTATRHLAVSTTSALEVYAVSGTGVFRTRNGGFDWEELTSGLRLQNVPFLYFHPAAPETLYACPPGRELIRSDDSGLSWRSAFRRFPGSGLAAALAINPRAQDTIAVVTGFDSNLHLTTDRGDSWTSYPIAARFSPRGVGYHPVGPDTLYTWGGLRDSTAGPEVFALRKSTTQGQTWSSLLVRGTSGTCLGFEATGSGETLFAWGSADRSAALYRSTDRGAGWTRLNSGVSGDEMRAFVSGPHDSVYFSATSAGVFRSLNNCANWTRLGLGNVSTILPDTLNIDYVYAGTDTQGLFYTTDAGVWWERDTVGFPSRSILLLARHPQNRTAIYCATAGAGLLGEGIIGIEEPRPAPTRGAPLVRPSIVRNRALVTLAPSDQRTTLDLYRPDGRLACRLGDVRPTPETVTFTRPPGLARGTYLLVIRTGTHRRAAKLVLAH